MEYLERERLHQARQLLESGLLRVKEAAEACGYAVYGVGVDLLVAGQARLRRRVFGYGLNPLFARASASGGSTTAALTASRYPNRSCMFGCNPGPPSAHSATL